MWVGSGDGPDGESYVEYGDGTSEFVSLDFALCLNDAEPLCTGDLDGDGDTDQSDLGILLASYDVDGGGDLDGDGDTDQSDLGILLADYGCVP
jgi:hypothetical protein